MTHADLAPKMKIAFALALVAMLGFVNAAPNKADATLVRREGCCASECCTPGFHYNANAGAAYETVQGYYYCVADTNESVDTKDQSQLIKSTLICNQCLTTDSCV